MARKFILIPVLLILSGAAGLGMTACGALFSGSGLVSWLSGHGEAQQYGSAMAMAGALMGLLPGIVVLLLTRWGWRRYHAPKPDAPHPDAPHPDAPHHDVPESDASSDTPSRVSTPSVDTEASGPH